MELNFKGLPQLLKRFPDNVSAREYLEQRIWAGTPKCPFCGCDNWYKLGKEGQYKCGDKKCHKKYTVTVGTIFHGSHIPLNIWFAAMYLVSSHKKGISSHQLAKDLNVAIITHLVDLHHYQITVKTAMKEKNFKVWAGQYYIDFEEDKVTLRKFDNREHKKICEI